MDGEDESAEPGALEPEFAQQAPDQKGAEQMQEYVAEMLAKGIRAP